MTFEELGIKTETGTGWQRTTCPQCSATRKKKNEKCLAYNQDEQAYKCHHCGWSGKISARKFKQIKPKKELKKPNNKLLDYFMERGLKTETVEKFGIRIVDDNTFSFPFIYYDHIINIKYRTYDKQFQQEKGAEQICYNYNDILDTDTLVIVEGEFDAMSVSQAGYRVISLPAGGFKGKAGAKLKWLDQIIDEMQNINQIILALDQDDTGYHTRDELARRLGKERCYIAIMPDDCKDMNDVLVKHGEEKVKKGIEDAEPYPLEGIFKADDVWDEIKSIYYCGYPAGAKIELINDFEFFTGYLNIVTGIPSHGKTTFVLNSLVELSKNSSWKHLIFSPEHRISINKIKLIRIFTGKKFGKNDSLDYINENELDEARLFLNEHFLILKPLNGIVTIDDILNDAERVIKQRGINTITIDPWNTIEHIWDRGNTETNYISYTLQQLKDFGHKHDVLINLIAHPVKMGYQNQIAKPTMYDIAGSAHFYNKADNGFIIFKDKNHTEVDIAKVKEDHIGKFGKRKYNFNENSLRFIPITKDENNAEEEIGF